MSTAPPVPAPVAVFWAVPDALRDRGLHVWRIDLDAGAEIDSALLAPSEVARAHRIGDAERRRRFLALRVTTRRILARYVDTEPRALAFGAGHRGKPHLVHPPTDLVFNLTDSGPLALLAVGHGGAVGVDLEAVRPVSRWQRIARRTFPESACLVIEAADPAARDTMFLAHWTAHEARQKATGEGLHGVRADVARWQVLHFTPAPGCIAALAFAADVTPALSWFDAAAPEPGGWATRHSSGGG